MQYCLDNSGNRIKPFKGGRSICPVCEGIRIAKCGDIYQWHWQHESRIDCDSWSEPETKWHRDWKEKFPEDQREIIMVKDAVKHIADVHNSNGTVIEFQNSSISAQVISDRETFYYDMIWIVNAKPFIQNFITKSMVDVKMLEYSNELKMNASMESYHYNSEDKEASKKISEIQREVDFLQSQFDRADYDVRTNNISEELINQSAEQMLKNWGTSRSYINFTSSFNTKMNDIWKPYSERTYNISQLKNQIEAKEAFIQKINSLESITFENKDYRFIEYDVLNKINWQRYIGVNKSRRKSLFADIVKFRSEVEFQSYAYKKRGFDFAFSSQEYIHEANLKILELTPELERWESDRTDYMALTKAALQTYHSKKLIEAKTNRDKLFKELSDLKYELDDLKREQIANKAFYDRRMEEYRQEEADQQEKEKNRIAEQYNGLYRLTWKSERKSWAAATRPVFFDVGKDYLYKRLRNDLLKRVPMSDFLNLYRPDIANVIP